MDIFQACQNINENLLAGFEKVARNNLIKLLDHHEKHNIPYSPLVNYLIRETGLYPYIQTKTANWQEKFVYEAFRVDTGSGEKNTLHREQSLLLKKIINGKNVAVSAPTSFGKSFIIDSFISIKRPQNVVIIVPTIALTDETRRRLYKKFSDQYKLITTAETPLSERNIFVFPQERALNYIDKIPTIDLLIIDEFYKASFTFDKERSPSLVRVIMKLGDRAKQKYFLAPNIHKIKDNTFVKDMDFVEMLDFNTVFLKKHDLYNEIGNDEKKKGGALLKILKENNSKSLIYAGTYADIDKIANLLVDNVEMMEKTLLKDFADWLVNNYYRDWKLIHLVRRGIGIHNGRLHRSLSQIQVKLFEEDNTISLNNIVSTSSIIEGVNTSAENVIVWRNRNGKAKLNDFTYKNIIGRAGRMFRHFIGNIYLLEMPPDDTQTQLDIPIPETLLGDVDEEKYRDIISEDHRIKIIEFKREMRVLLGNDFDRMIRENIFQTSNSELIKKITLDMKTEPSSWKGLAHLNSNDPNDWDRLLFKAIKFQGGIWDIKHSKFVKFVKILSKNWRCSIPELMPILEPHGIGIDQFFTLERNVTYKLSAILSDINELQKIIFDSEVDISPFISKTSHAFLPPVVHQLEEYGLPRMISKKLHSANVIDFEDSKLDLHSAIAKFHVIGKNEILSLIELDRFDKYIVEYFYDGVTLSN